VKSVFLYCFVLAATGFAAEQKPRIAVFSGPTATIQNSRPLVTSNKARVASGLPRLNGRDGKPVTFDELHPQRLATPATVYIEQFSAHPLEQDAAELYAPPDGYIQSDGRFAKERHEPTDKPVYVVTLAPEDGLYPLPFMGRQVDGSAWESTATKRGAPFLKSRQTFYPNAARIFEEIERSGGHVYEKAEYDFFRPAPSGGYTKGLSSAARADEGSADTAPETIGEDFFSYGPYNSSPSRPHLARATNIVQRALATGDYDGAIWLEGSPSIEDTLYWLSLVVDTTKPIVGNSAQRARGLISADGDANIVDSVDYITSGVWRDSEGRDRVGAVAIMDQVIYNAREVQKGDARPGGYVTTGGFGGIVGTTDYGSKLTFLPVRKSTHRSDLRVTQLPSSVSVVAQSEGGLTTVPFTIKDADGNLLPAAIPLVTFAKSARWQTDNDAVRDSAGQVEILARLEALLAQSILGGLVSEGFAPYGFAPYGSSIAPAEAALDRVVLSGFPVVQSARGDAHGFMQSIPDNLRIEATNGTATKSRMLLMACLLKFGALPPAKNPSNPTPAEISAIKEKIKVYQAAFDTH
jgi:L-asparaginase